MVNTHFLGWDMGAALAMGAAMGLPAHLVADILPEIEPVVMAALNKGSESDG